MIPMTSNTTIESFIHASFERNFEALRIEGGHTLAPAVKEAALYQTLLYWRRLGDIACSVTDTEVLLTLQGQTTPGKRLFGIEGVVDIVREQDRTTMYDTKTHDAEQIQANLAAYEKQLNVYAYIWKQLRGQDLDGTAVIATEYPDRIGEALKQEDWATVDDELPNWNPLIPIPYDTAHVAETIREFGAVVDAIEEGQFAPPPPETLRSRRDGAAASFATSVCVNCDARFSCGSYRAYAASSRGTAERHVRRYLDKDLDTR